MRGFYEGADARTATAASVSRAAPAAATAVPANDRLVETLGRIAVYDSLTAALIQRERIPALATSDRDFERLQRLRVYSPSDLPWPAPSK